MNKDDRKQLKDFDKKIDILNDRLNKIDNKINLIDYNHTKITSVNGKLNRINVKIRKHNDKPIKLHKKIPRILENIFVSLLTALVIILIFVPMYYDIIESREADKIYYVLTTDEIPVISNEKIVALYNFTVLNFNTEIIDKEVTLRMSFNFEDENISVTEIGHDIHYPEHEITENTIKYVWDYIPEKVGDSPWACLYRF